MAQNAHLAMGYPVVATGNRRCAMGENGENAIEVRVARTEDARGLLEIYAPYVRNTAITFETEVPSASEFERRIARTLERYPYLVAERDGVPVGYAYASPFKGRPAYDWAIETSLYVDAESRRSGVGARLHAALETALRAQGVRNMYACIAVPASDGEDPYLTRDSVRFHEHMGYRLVGEFERCGCKFGRWYSMVWMERMIGGHEPHPEHPLPFDAGRAEAALRRMATVTKCRSAAPFGDIS